MAYTEIDSKEWIQKAEAHGVKQLELLQKSCHFVDQLENNAIPLGKNALAQGLEMADALLELNCDSQTLAAAILYPAYFHHKLSSEKLRQTFGNAIVKLLVGAKRMEAIQDFRKDSHQLSVKKTRPDNLRKMLLAMVDDIRVVLIKLVERVSILNYLRFAEPEDQKRIAEQTMHVYAPLANRLGIGQLKWQMEDLSFRYINPEQYQEISKALNMRRTDRDDYITMMQNTLADMLSQAGIKNAEISGRAKHIFSIYRKVTRKNVDISEIYDASAFRILVPTLKDCYTALSLVHSEWSHISKEFDDYIANPKPNGYQSIHTVVIGPQDINVEIQFRTYQMHEEAELGVAAHWKYKEGATSASSYEEKISWLREVMDWQKEISEEDDDENKLTKVFEDRVYVFTPNGDVFDLPAGATPLDFAYHIHTDVGHRCRGAKINDVLVPLTHKLKTGDQVNILTSKENAPSRDWINPNLGYLKTHAALTKVRHWFHRQNYEEHLEEGQSLWEKTARRGGVKKIIPDDVVAHFNFKNTQDLLASVGSGDLSATALLHEVRAQSEPQQKPNEIDDAVIKPHDKHTHIPKSNLNIKGVDNLLTQLAGCCKPIPGDDIIGFITKGRGITIHQRECHNIHEALKEHEERRIEVSWGNESPQAYPVDLTLEANDRTGLVRDISNILASEKIPLLAINTSLVKKNNIAHVTLTIETQSLEPLQKILANLRQIPGVSKVSRS